MWPWSHGESPKNDNVLSQLISLWFYMQKEEESSYFYCFSSIHSLLGAFVVWVFVLRIICTLLCFASLSLRSISIALYIFHIVLWVIPHSMILPSWIINQSLFSKSKKKTKGRFFPTGGYRYREGGGDFAPPSTAIKGFFLWLIMRMMMAGGRWSRSSPSEFRRRIPMGITSNWDPDLMILIRGPGSLQEEALYAIGLNWRY